MNGWSLLPNALRPFKIYCSPPNLGITRTWICRLNFAQRPIFSSRRTCAQDFYVLKKSIDVSRVWTREPWISRRTRYPETTEYDRIIWSALRSVMFNNVGLLIRSATSQSSSYPIGLTRLSGPSSIPNPHLKFVEVPRIEAHDQQTYIKHSYNDRKDVSWLNFSMK